MNYLRLMTILRYGRAGQTRQLSSLTLYCCTCFDAAHT